MQYFEGRRPGLQGALRSTFAVRPLSAAAAEPQPQRADGKQAGARGREKDALAVDEAQFDAITDQIPQRPMGVVEGTSYTLLILAGVAVAGAWKGASKGYSFVQAMLTHLSASCGQCGKQC